MDFEGKIPVKGSDWFIGGFQSVSVIYLEGLKPQGRGLPPVNYVRGQRTGFSVPGGSHVAGLMTDPG